MLKIKGSICLFSRKLRTEYGEVSVERQVSNTCYDFPMSLLQRLCVLVPQSICGLQPWLHTNLFPLSMFDSSHFIVSFPTRQTCTSSMLLKVATPSLMRHMTAASLQWHPYKCMQHSSVKKAEILPIVNTKGGLC